MVRDTRDGTASRAERKPTKVPASKSNTSASDQRGVSADDLQQARLQALQRLQRWYRLTKNPLFVWETIAHCLHDDASPEIPPWCLDYLRSAATNLFDLSRRKDFRIPDSPAFRLSTHQALKLVPEALSLSKRGKRNAFASLLEDRDTARDANRYLIYGKSSLEQIQKQRNVSLDRAQRIVSKGKRLLGRGKS
jgi:hypothetical protein